MSCYLITGGAGFFGTVLKQHLLKQGAECVSIDLEPDSFQHPRFTAYQGDINDDSLMERYSRFISPKRFFIVPPCWHMSKRI